MHFVDSNPPTPLLENKRQQFDMNGVLHCIVVVNFSVYPFELCFELSYVSTSLMLPGSKKALQFSFFFSFLSLHIALCTLVLAIVNVLTELISCDSYLKVSCYCNAYGAMKLMVRMNCLIVNYLLCAKWEFLSMLYNIYMHSLKEHTNS